MSALYRTQFVRGTAALNEGTVLRGERTRLKMPIAGDYAEALSVAHAAGVIHRDVKPENALVDGDGVLKVMDFGIARLAANTGTTVAGMIVGTPMYMSPEQAAGKPVDKRADIWSFGVVVWEMLTGRRLFGRDQTESGVGRSRQWRHDGAARFRRGQVDSGNRQRPVHDVAGYRRGQRAVTKRDSTC